MFVVVHVPENATSTLPKLLTRRGKLTAIHPTNGQSIQWSRIYVAPPNCHMILEPERIRLVRGPREHGVRPAVDPLFRSAASSYGPRVAAVTLSGNLDDGTAGLERIKARGGISLVQNPKEAQYSGMIESAIHSGFADEILSAGEIGTRLTELVTEDSEKETAALPERERQDRGPEGERNRGRRARLRPDAW